ncbi:ABC transporter ATP-binding protein [Methanoculleus bourgensis]|uniref:Xenobiotic-transporting ATPase n=2 Tax=Methanoculleus TaxID=45989 RepID=A0A0X3BJC9_9EURY|nr:ABC transporter ATP-binding protein [Methanoculleus bourgensis]CVK32252.1 Xenobiotic-transporting ATPase [Methanoculleus bourgensis]
MKDLIDDVITQRKTESFTYLIGLLFLICISSSIARYFSVSLTGKISAKVTNSIRKGIFISLQCKKLNEIYKVKSGDVLSRFMNDIYVCQNLFTSYIVQLFSCVFGIIFPLTIMLMLKWDLTVICIAPIVIYVPLSFYFGQFLKMGQKKILEINGKISTFLRESLSMIPLIKSFGLEKYQQVRFEENLDTYYNSILSVSHVSALYLSITNALIFFPLLMLFIVGGKMAINEIISIGTLFAFSAYLMQFYSPVNSLANLWSNIKMSSAAFDRLHEIVELEAESDGKMDLKSENKEIVFENVSFSYGKNKIFERLNITFKKGMNFVIGANGSGKTTIFHLLIKLYTVEAGAIKIDSQDISEVSLPSLRRNIALLSQNIQLIDSSIYENILLGNLSASEDAVVNAAKKAKIHDFIVRLPNGYNSLVGEDGLALSGGERQKISLARAILKDSPIILLDEVTSPIDKESRDCIYNVLRELSSGKIIIIATHDCSEIREGDWIVDLNKVNVGNRILAPLL